MLDKIEEVKKESGSETSTPKVGLNENIDSFQKAYTKSTVKLEDTLVASGDVFNRESLPQVEKVRNIGEDNASSYQFSMSDSLLQTETQIDATIDPATIPKDHILFCLECGEYLKKPHPLNHPILFASNEYIKNLQKDLAKETQN